MKLTLHIEDLSLETLSSIKNDLSRYAHLAMYRETWQEIVITIEERARASQALGAGAGKVIPNITGVAPRPTTSYADAAKQLLSGTQNPVKEG